MLWMAGPPPPPGLGTARSRTETEPGKALRGGCSRCSEVTILVCPPSRLGDPRGRRSILAFPADHLGSQPALARLSGPSAPPLWGPGPEQPADVPRPGVRHPTATLFSKSCHHSLMLLPMPQFPHLDRREGKGNKGGEYVPRVYFMLSTAGADFPFSIHQHQCWAGCTAGACKCLFLTLECLWGWSSPVVLSSAESQGSVKELSGEV